MLKKLCKGCELGPCKVDSTTLRPVWQSCYKAIQPNRSYWKFYIFTGFHQCMCVINTRADLSICNSCGHYFEKYLLHFVQDKDKCTYELCVDCYQQSINNT